MREQNESGTTKRCRQERHSAGGRPQFHHFQANSRATESRRYDAHCIISDRSWIGQDTMIGISMQRTGDAHGLTPQ